MRILLLGLATAFGLGATAQASSTTYDYQCRESVELSRTAGPKLDLSISEEGVTFKGVKAVRTEQIDAFSYVEKISSTTVSVGGEIGAKKIMVAILGESTLNRTETYLCNQISQ